MSAASHLLLPAPEFPLHASIREQLAFAARIATQAAGHAARTWDFRLRDEALELWVAPRNHPSVDAADDREALVGCGEALEYLQSSLAQSGGPGRIDYFPSLEDPNLVARIRPARRGNPDRACARFLDPAKSHAVVPWRPDGNGIPESTLGLLAQTTARERSWLEFALGEASRERLRHLMARPDRFQAAAVHHRDRRDRTASAVNTSGSGWFRGPFARWRKAHLTVTMGTAEARAAAELSATPADLTHSVLAVVKTKTDDKHGWVAAGHTLGRSQLQARALGIKAIPLPEPLRNARLRAELRPAFGHKGFVQSFVRFEPMHQVQPGVLPTPTQSSRNTVPLR